MRPTELTAAAARRLVPPRLASSRKGQNGSVLVVGGGPSYHGAPVLAAVAALRAGADLAYVAAPAPAAAAARALSPDVIVMQTADYKLTRGSARKLLGRAPPGVGAAVVGPGLAVQDRGALAWLVSSLRDAGAGVVLDAAALVPEALPAARGGLSVLTPHAGEFARAFGREPPGDLPARARAVEEAAASCGSAVLLKGPADVISDGSSTYVCRRGCPAMTAGGTGDVLAGVAASLLARGRSPAGAAAAAAFVCGRAGEIVQRRLGPHMVASDMWAAIPEAFRGLDRAA